MFIINLRLELQTELFRKMNVRSDREIRKTSFQKLFQWNVTLEVRLLYKKSSVYPNKTLKSDAELRRIKHQKTVFRLVSLPFHPKMMEAWLMSI